MVIEISNTDTFTGQSKNADLKSARMCTYRDSHGKMRAGWVNEDGDIIDSNGAVVRDYDSYSYVKVCRNPDGSHIQSPMTKRKSVVKPSVTHPAYYKDRKIEPIDVIEAWGLDFCLGNAVKYIARAGKKDGDSAEEDLSKAIWYIRRYLERRYE